MDNRLSSLVRTFGPYKIQKDGDELLFKCPKGCGWKLSYSPAKEVFHPCFRCTWTVKLKRTGKKLVRAIQPRQKEAEDLPIEIPGFRPVVTGEVIKFLVVRGIKPILDWGMCTDPRLKGRLIIPIVENGKIMSYVARAVNGEQPKELSAPNRSHFLYGWDQVYDRHVEGVMGIVLVEGIFDQIKVNNFNWPCLALMGSSISDIQIGKLIKLKPSRVILMMDGDDAGRKATKTIAAKLGKRMNPMKIRQVYLPEGKDPDDLTREEFMELMRNI